MGHMYATCFRWLHAKMWPHSWLCWRSTTHAPLSPGMPIGRFRSVREPSAAEDGILVI